MGDAALPTPADDGLAPGRVRLFYLAILVVTGAALLRGLRLQEDNPDIWTKTIFIHQYIRHDLPAAWWTLLGCAVALAVAPWIPATWVSRTVHWTADHPWPWATATGFVAAVAAVVVHRAYPLALDEYAPCYEAQLFLGGKLVAEYPPDWIEWLFPGEFRSMFFDASAITGRATSSYWPAYALLLTPFMAVGVPWLLNPLLAGGSVLLVHRIARRISDDALAPGWAVLLLVATNAFLINAATYYSMTAHLFLNLVFVLLLLELTPARLLAAGVVGSIALTLHNPVPHTAFAVPWILAVWRGERGWRNLGLLAAGYLPLAVVFGVGWLGVRRSIYAAAGTDAGFNDHFADVAGKSFTLPDVEMVLNRYLGLLKFCLWTTPGLALLALYGAEKAWERQPVRLLAWSALLTALAYLPVRFDQGHGWGYRYFHSALGTLPLLAIFALSGAGPAAERLRQVVWVLVVLSLTAGSALRFDQTHEFVESHLAQLPAVASDGRQVCFVHFESGYYVVDTVQNDPFLRNSRLYFLSHGSAADADFVARHFQNPRLLEQRQGHSVWRVD